MFAFPYMLCLLFATQPCGDTVFEHPIGKQAPAALDVVAARMQQTPVLRAVFNQEKSIKALRRPLKSSGQFIFAAGHGVYWHTQQPFETIFIISDAGIYQKSEGTEPMQISADKQPMIAEFNNIFAALFRGDREALEAGFDVHFQGSEQDWQLGLIPKSKTMRRVIDSLVVCGNQTVQTIFFNEAGGNQTLITFDAIETPQNLSQQEQANFEF